MTTGDSIEEIRIEHKIAEADEDLRLKGISENFLTSPEMAQKSKYEHDKSSIREWIIVVPYLGGILSENAYKYSTRGTKPFVRLWMKELAEKVRQLDIPRYETYEIGVFGKFTDERRPDIPNLFKVISDAIEKGLGVNDKHFRLIDKGYELGWTDPELVITITPLERWLYKSSL